MKYLMYIVVNMVFLSYMTWQFGSKCALIFKINIGFIGFFGPIFQGLYWMHFPTPTLVRRIMLLVFKCLEPLLLMVFHQSLVIPQWMKTGKQQNISPLVYLIMLTQVGNLRCQSVLGSGLRETLGIICAVNCLH